MPDIFDAKLLPCPFCGGAAEWEYTPWNEENRTGDDGTGWIECQGCHLQITGYDRDDAEQRWNKRHNDKAQGEAQGSSRLSPGATGSAAGAPEKGKR